MNIYLMILLGLAELGSAVFYVSFPSLETFLFLIGITIMGSIIVLRNININRYEFAGWLFVIAGLLNAFVFISLIYSKGSISINGQDLVKNASDAGGFIGGTSGAFWALAGVFFFVSALLLQQQEMKERSFEAKFYNILNQINIARPQRFRREGFLINRWVEQKNYAKPQL